MVAFLFTHLNYGLTRVRYSSPPIHGALLVDEVLGDAGAGGLREQCVQRPLLGYLRPLLTRLLGVLPFNSLLDGHPVSSLGTTAS